MRPSWPPLLLLLSLVYAELQCGARLARLCRGAVHVACQYTEPGPGETCENYTEVKFNDELKHFMIHYINRRRQKVASGQERVRGGAKLPKPELMMFVEWDRELAMLAQRLADQCLFTHDECRATVRYPYAGQAVGEVRWRKTSDSPSLMAMKAIRRVLDAWWGERRRAAPRQLTQPFHLGRESSGLPDGHEGHTARAGRVVGRAPPRQLTQPFHLGRESSGGSWGHFSQLAVWSLRAVGCGAVIHGTEPQKLLLVCDFSHTNMLGQRTLKAGPLAPCPFNTVRKRHSPYYLLCAPIRSATKLLEDGETNEDEEEIRVPPAEHRGFHADDTADYVDTVTDLHITNKTFSHRNKDRPKIGDKEDKDQNDKSEAKVYNYLYELTKDIENNDKQPITYTTTPIVTDYDTEKHNQDRNIEEDIEKNTTEVKPEKTDRSPLDDDRFLVDAGKGEVDEDKIDVDDDLSVKEKDDSVMYGTDSRRMVFINTTPAKDGKLNEATFPNFERLPNPTTVGRRSNLEPHKQHIQNNPLMVAKHNLNEEKMKRRNWHQTRHRPDRPGAKALLSSTLPANLQTRSTTRVTLMMDKEDEEQLYKDTGFSIKWNS
ncbi:unnamed protein product [Plutella xylostella]|uniref:(diamondback moth) hypothetical protein n=1 Tax=Plutella xylostella TaxID=51655 RepID=A0A8S4EUP1_PLUXY|nr:unnamed protein product [Plutella xylostella]